MGRVREKYKCWGRRALVRLEGWRTLTRPRPAHTGRVELLLVRPHLTQLGLLFLERATRRSCHVSPYVTISLNLSFPDNTDYIYTLQRRFRDKYLNFKCTVACRYIWYNRHPFSSSHAKLKCGCCRSCSSSIYIVLQPCKTCLALYISGITAGDCICAAVISFTDKSFSVRCVWFSFIRVISLYWWV